MNTLKTAIVVVVLLAVLYGVYRVLNMPDPQALRSDLFSLAPTAPQGSPEPERNSDLSVSLGQPQDTGQPATEGSSSRTSADSAQLVTPPAAAPARTPPSAPSAYNLPGQGSDPSAAPADRSAAQPERLDATAAPVDAAAKAEPGSAPAEQAPAGREADPFALRGFERALREARAQIAEGRFRDALATLSVYYGLPGLTQERRQELFQWLDPLAGKVIYSTEHRLEAPYIVRRGDTLKEIARRYDVPWQLLYNINRSAIRDPETLDSGTELKVVRGPFRAHINLVQRELTLFLGQLYAGRFPITLGHDPEPQPGLYTVKDKQQWREYYTRTGQTIPAGHPANPYGQWWLDLGSGVAIHGSPDLEDPTRPSGCISLDAPDAADVYAILSKGSRVEIRR